MFRVISGNMRVPLNNLPLLLAPPPLVSRSVLVSGEKIVSSDTPGVIWLSHMLKHQWKVNRKLAWKASSRAMEWNLKLII